jgi:hypothetical protein
MFIRFLYVAFSAWLRIVPVSEIVFTIPEVITLATELPFGACLVDFGCMRRSPQFDDVAARFCATCTALYPVSVTASFGSPNNVVMKQEAVHCVAHGKKFLVSRLPPPKESRKSAQSVNPYFVWHFLLRECRGEAFSGMGMGKGKF